ncbi:hypothetical protein Prum_052630 [Phytohabitans rumicis]|uniref:Uncharacterized protein n=1 Tax=Phytohabitans rumicis TaxID=1076125 RepID=A0A6V8LA06_9ACTN|nr:hypothetical protein Prum_052630 [Phytohabitans rumicis]
MVALPRITAQIRSPAATASAYRFSTTTPQPSLRTMPSARPSNGWQRPRGDIAWMARMYVLSSGPTIRLTPPARAASHSPVTSARVARWTASREEAQAAFSIRQGPRRSNVYATRPAPKLNSLPLA